MVVVVFGNTEVKVASLQGASAAVLSHIGHMGSQEWYGSSLRVGDVYDQGKLVARVSYNGRVWPPGPWRPGMKPLLEA